VRAPLPAVPYDEAGRMVSAEPAPSSLLRIPMVAIETNGLSTICLQSNYSYFASNA